MLYFQYLIPSLSCKWSLEGFISVAFIGIWYFFHWNPFQNDILLLLFTWLDILTLKSIKALSNSKVGMKKFHFITWLCLLGLIGQNTTFYKVVEGDQMRLEIPSSFLPVHDQKQNPTKKKKNLGRQMEKMDQPFWGCPSSRAIVLDIGLILHRVLPLKYDYF